MAMSQFYKMLRFLSLSTFMGNSFLKKKKKKKNFYGKFQTLLNLGKKEKKYSKK